MRRPAVWTSLACGAATLIAGCGTVLNLTEQSTIPVGDPPRRVYGGVQIDNKFGTKFRQRDLDDQQADATNAALWAATVIDLPLSAIGDTLTLPYTLWLQSQATKNAPPPVPPANPAP